MGRLHTTRYSVIFKRLRIVQEGPLGPQKGPDRAQTNPFCLFSRAGWFHMGYNSAG